MVGLLSPPRSMEDEGPAYFAKLAERLLPLTND